MPDLALTIPSWLIWAAAITLTWWALGYAFNNTILSRHQRRYLRRNRTGIVPGRYATIACLVCGPVGWLILISESKFCRSL